MKPIPQTENPLVLRTDFSNPAAWQNIRATILEPVSEFGFLANVEFVDNPEYCDLTKDQLLELIPQNYNHSFIILADQTTHTASDHPLLVINLYEKSGCEFRAEPEQIQSIENNLSIANMDFEDFANSLAEDGVFRGFPES